MTARNLTLEVWRSNDNREERHVFLADDRNSYVLGWNPELIPMRQVYDCLLASGVEMSVGSIACDGASLVPTGTGHPKTTSARADPPSPVSTGSCAG